MKKVLFATTALVATAGIASAEATMSLSGYARVGIQQDYSADSGTALDTRFQLGATGSVETANGTTYSVYSRLRVDDSERADGFNAPTLTIANGGFKVQIGNTYSAAGARTNVFGSMTGLNGDFGLYDTFGTWYSSTGAAGMDRVRIDYSMGDMVVSVSGDVSGDERIEAGVSGSAGGLNFGVALSDGDYYAADINAAMGDMTIGARFTDTLNGAYANYSMGGAAVQAYVGDNDDWGLGYTQDLGGATLGAEYNETGAFNVTVGFSF